MFIFIYAHDVDIVSVSFFVSLPNHANSMPTWNVSRLRSNILLDDTTRNNFGNIPLASFFFIYEFQYSPFFSEFTRINYIAGTLDEMYGNRRRK